MVNRSVSNGMKFQSSVSSRFMLVVAALSVMSAVCDYTPSALHREGMMAGEAEAMSHKKNVNRMLTQVDTKSVKATPVATKKEIVSKHPKFVMPTVHPPPGSLPEASSWASATEKITARINDFQDKDVDVKRRNLVIFHVGEMNEKDSKEVVQNNIKIFTSSIAKHTEKGENQAMYVFNVVGATNPLRKLLPAESEQVAILTWEETTSDMLTHIRTVELLGPITAEQFNSIVFLNQGVRGPMTKREDGEWLRDYNKLLSDDNVGLVGSTISCEKTPHVQTHAFAVRSSVFPIMNNLLHSDVPGQKWTDVVSHFEIGLTTAVTNAGYSIASLLNLNRKGEDVFASCVTPAPTDVKTVTPNPSSWCDIKGSEVTFVKWGGEPLRTNGFVCDDTKDHMQEALLSLALAEPKLGLAVPEAPKGGIYYDLYSQYASEVYSDGSTALPERVVSLQKEDDNVCFLVRSHDNAQAVAKSQFVNYGVSEFIASLKKQTVSKWLAVFINTDSKDYPGLSSTVGAFNDERLRVINIPQSHRPLYTAADAGYSATDYAMGEMKTWAQCKYVTVTNSDNVYGTEIVERVLSARVESEVNGAVQSVSPNLILAPLDSRNFYYQDMFRREVAQEYTSRCTNILANLEMTSLAATSQPVPILGKVDLAAMFFEREKLDTEKTTFNDVASPRCPGCQDGLFAEHVTKNRDWNYVRLPVDGLKSIVYHGPSPTLCIAAGNVWYDYPMVNGVGCYSHSAILSLYRDTATREWFDWSNYEAHDRTCLRLNAQGFEKVKFGQSVPLLGEKVVLKAEVTTEKKSELKTVAKVEQKVVAKVAAKAVKTPAAVAVKKIDVAAVETLVAAAKVNLLAPSIMPSVMPTTVPSEIPTFSPSFSDAPTVVPTTTPTEAPTVSHTPSEAPSTPPTEAPTVSITPTASPTATITIAPTPVPNIMPSIMPTAEPSHSDAPSVTPTATPSSAPSHSDAPSQVPSVVPTEVPTHSTEPSQVPSVVPTEVPSHSTEPSQVPSVVPTEVPSHSTEPSQMPSVVPTEVPSHSTEPSQVPSVVPTEVPTHSQEPSQVPSVVPTEVPSHSHEPSQVPSVVPTEVPSHSHEPSQVPSKVPTAVPTITQAPSQVPTAVPSVTGPTATPSVVPTTAPTTAAVQFSVVQGVNGITYDQYTADEAANQLTLQQTIVQSMTGITLSDIKSFTVTTAPTRRALRESNVHTLDTGIQMQYTIATNTPGLNYNTLSSQLNTAVTSGQFTDDMQTNAGINGATTLTTATSTTVAVTNDIPEGGGGSDSNGLSGGAIAGIAIAVIVFVGAAFYAYTVYFGEKTSSGSAYEADRNSKSSDSRNNSTSSGGVGQSSTSISNTKVRTQENPLKSGQRSPTPKKAQSKYDDESHLQL